MSTNLFQRFCKAFAQSKAKLTPKAAQQQAIQKWNDLLRLHNVEKKRNKGKVKEFEADVLTQIAGYIKAANRQEATLKSFWVKQQAPKQPPLQEPPSAASSTSTGDGSEQRTQGTFDGHSQPSGDEVPFSLENDDEEAVDDPGAKDSSHPLPAPSPSATPAPAATPAQDALRSRLALLQADLDLAVRRRDAPTAAVEDHLKVVKLRKEVDAVKKSLRKRQQHVFRSRRYRVNLRRKIQTLAKQTPGTDGGLREGPGRPRLEESQPLLLQSIIDIAMFGASAEEKRRCEIVRSCRTLDDLHTKLKELGYNLSRSATYLRLLPRRYDTAEGKRHVVTVPVKLRRPEADVHKCHQDQGFCVATIRALETVASILGPNQVFFLSQDDKARVPIGIVAANKQSPMLMHMEYRVSLPDHDWVVAGRHKLIPSVYGACAVTDEVGRPQAVSYSGPTMICIRSAKHSSSTASTHAQDFEKVITSELFKDFARENGRVKPVVMISSDGGPDENPRYAKVIAHSVDHFVKHDLDALFVFTNAPGRSAFNRIERRMAPLSKEMAGLLLPHDSCGSHLDSQNRTVDSELEKANFKKAGEILAAVRNPMVIDKYAVQAEYVDPDSEGENSIPDLPSQNWYCTHVQESQYLLQIVKCGDASCCGPWRSSLRTVLPDRFLPPPNPLLQTPTGLVIPAELEQHKFSPLLLQISLRLPVQHPGFLEMPYDYYCPSLSSQPNALTNRVCKDCGKYFASKKAVVAHRQALRCGCGGADVDTARVMLRPERVVARRSARIRDQQATELLCVVRQDELEWLEEAEVDVEGVPDDRFDEEDDVPLIHLAKALQTPWEEAV